MVPKKRPENEPNISKISSKNTQKSALSKPGPRNLFPLAGAHPKFVAAGPEGNQNLKIIQVDFARPP